MRPIETVDDLIALFGSIAEMSRQCDAPQGNISQWKLRGVIPEPNWPGILSGAAQAAETDPRFGMVNTKLLHTINETARASKREPAAGAA